MELLFVLITVRYRDAGLDSATTFSVTKWLRVISHALQLTTVVSLLQPAPEVFQLFDDVLLLTDGCAPHHPGNPCTSNQLRCKPSLYDIPAV